MPMCEVGPTMHAILRLLLEQPGLTARDMARILGGGPSYAQDALVRLRRLDCLHRSRQPPPKEGGSRPYYYYLNFEGFWRLELLACSLEGQELQEYIEYLRKDLFLTKPQYSILGIGASRPQGAFVTMDLESMFDRSANSWHNLLTRLRQKRFISVDGAQGTYKKYYVNQKKFDSVRLSNR